MFDLRKTARCIDSAAELACALLLVSGCSSTSGGGGQANADSGTSDSSTPGGECQPVEHTTEGKTGEPDAPGKSRQRYRFVGRSDDGTRVAVLFSHFGPSSGAPFANLGVFELGKPTTLFTTGRFQYGGSSEDDLAAVEQAVLTASQQAFADHAIVADKRPDMVRWCEASGSVHVGTSSPMLAKLTLREGICPIDDKSPLTRWSMCMPSSGDGRCAEGIVFTNEEATTCDNSSEISFVDVVRAGDVLWFVAQRKVKGIDEDYIVLREVGAMRVSP